MKITYNEEKYSKLQDCLMLEIMKAVKDVMEAEGASGEFLKKVTGDIAFQICAIIDSSQVVECEGAHFAPNLTFWNDENCTTAIASENGSNMHELLFFRLESLFNDRAS